MCPSCASTETKELGHILRASKAKAFITAEQFGRMGFSTPTSAGDVPVVGVVGRDYDDLLAQIATVRHF